MRNFSIRILVLATAAMLYTACNESDPYIPPDRPATKPEHPTQNEPECTQSVCLNEQTLNECIEGKFQEVSCKDINQICENDACIEKTEEPEEPVIIPRETCTQSTCDADGHTLHECLGGYVYSGDCQQLNMICQNAECVEAPCEDGDVVCDGSVLKTCVDHVYHKQDCAATHQFCNLDIKACDPIECDETFQNSCIDAHTVRNCINHKVVVQECKDNYYCSKDRCKLDPCSLCTESQYCINEQCMDSFNAPRLGIPCKCESEDCNTLITSTEFKGTLKNVVLLMANSYLDKLGPDDNIIVPNYFSKSNRGCEVLEEVVPEGMTVGCFRTSNVSFPETYRQLIIEDAPELLALLDVSSSPALMAIANKVANLMSANITIPAPNGYCMTSAVEMSMKFGSPANMAFEPDALSKTSPIMSKINTGNPALVAQKSSEAEAAGEDYCPDGGQLFYYDVERTVDKAGDIKAKIGLCLQSCDTDDDCRAPYTCMDIPISISLSNLDNVPRKKACFNQETKDAFKGWLGSLMGMMSNDD